MKNNACKRVSTDQEAVELISRENLEILMDRGSVENLLGKQRAQKISSMNREVVEDLSRSQEEGLIERNLSRICQEAVKLEKRRFFKKGKTQKDECNKQAT